MIASQPSLQRPYVEFFSGDPAFVQPPDEPGDDATDEQRAAYKEAIEQYQDKLRHARETGNWDALRVDGAEPTGFNMRPLTAQVFNSLSDAARSGMGHVEVCTLAFRVSLTGVSNFGKKVELKYEQHRKFGKIPMLSFLDDAKIPPIISLRIVMELGGVVLERANRLGPKS